MTIKSHTSVLASIFVTAILLIGCSQKNKEEISFTDIDSSISTALDGWNYKIEPSDLAQICDDVLNSSKNMLKKIEDDRGNSRYSSVFIPDDEMGKNPRMILLKIFYSRQGISRRRI